MTATITDPKVSLLVTSLGAQVKNVNRTLDEAGVPRENRRIAVPGMSNWYVGPDGLLFGDTYTAYTAEEFAKDLYDPIAELRRSISMLSHMTHPSFVGKLLA